MIKQQELTLWCTNCKAIIETSYCPLCSTLCIAKPLQEAWNYKEPEPKPEPKQPEQTKLLSPTPKVALLAPIKTKNKWKKNKNTNQSSK